MNSFALCAIFSLAVAAVLAVPAPNSDGHGAVGVRVARQYYPGYGAPGYGGGYGGGFGGGFNAATASAQATSGSLGGFGGGNGFSQASANANSFSAGK